MAIYCPHCGRETLPGAKFCSSCGNTLGQGAQPAQPSTPAWQGNTYTVVQPAGTNSNSRKKPGQTILAVALSVVLVVETCVAGFKYPGWFVKDKKIETVQPVNDTKTTRTVELNDGIRDVLDYLGMSEEEYIEMQQNPIEVTAENSPGNPRFIDVSFSQQDYDSALTLTAPVSWEEPRADFPELGIHVDLKEWNLENETDTLIVKQLPDKTCSVTGDTLYTYDFSLASGQKEFPTNVEVTVPIRDTDNFSGAVHFNEETGQWEEDYYLLSEDGQSYTAYMSHFSPTSSKSSGGYSLDDIKDFFVKADKDALRGCSLYCISPYRLDSKYFQDEHTSFIVGLSMFENYETYMDTTDAAVTDMLERLVDKSGGIPADFNVADGYSSLMDDSGRKVATCEGYNTMAGEGLDAVSNGSTAVGLFKDLGAVGNVGGIVLYGAGVSSLGIKVSGQIIRGVSAGKIFQSNWVGATTAVIGGVGAYYTASAMLTGAATGGFAAAVVASGGTVAAAAGVICAGIYSVNKAYEWAEARKNKNYPFGYPRTLEEGALYYYLADYDPSTNFFAKNAFKNATAKYPPLDGAKVPDIKMDVRGGASWSNALNFIIEHYRDDPTVMAKCIDELYKAYENSIDLFYSADLKTQRELCWREFCSNFLSDSTFKRRDMETDYTSISDFSLSEIQKIAKADQKSEAQKYGTTVEEIRRWSKMANSAIDRMTLFGANWEQMWKGENGYPFDAMNFDLADKEKIGELKSHCMDVIRTNSNSVIYAIYMKYHTDSIIELRRWLFEQVLPFMNTRVTFYLDDSAILADPDYDTFKFDGSTKPLFDTRMGLLNFFTDFIMRPDAYPLEMVRRDNHVIVLETSIFHYIRFGCPTNVTASSSRTVKPDVEMLADWSKVPMMPTDNDYKEIHVLGQGKIRLPYKDYQVPIVRRGLSKNAENENSLDGTVRVYNDEFVRYKQEYFDNGDFGIGAQPLNVRITANWTPVKNTYKATGEVDFTIPSLDISYISDVYFEGTDYRNNLLHRDTFTLHGMVKEVMGGGENLSITGYITDFPQEICSKIYYTHHHNGKENYVNKEDLRFHDFISTAENNLKPLADFYSGVSSVFVIHYDTINHRITEAYIELYSKRTRTTESYKIPDDKHKGPDVDEDEDPRKYSIKFYDEDGPEIPKQITW